MPELWDYLDGIDTMRFLGEFDHLIEHKANGKME